MRLDVAEADKPTPRLVFKLVRFNLEVLEQFFGVVAPAFNDNFDGLIKGCLNLDLNILIVMLETELKRPAITEIIPSENLFMCRFYLAIF